MNLFLAPIYLTVCSLFPTLTNVCPIAALDLHFLYAEQKIGVTDLNEELVKELEDIFYSMPQRFINDGLVTEEDIESWGILPHALKHIESVIDKEKVPWPLTLDNYYNLEESKSVSKDAKRVEIVMNYCKEDVKMISSWAEAALQLPQKHTKNAEKDLFKKLKFAIIDKCGYLDFNSDNFDAKRLHALRQMFNTTTFNDNHFHKSYISDEGSKNGNSQNLLKYEARNFRIIPAHDVDVQGNEKWIHLGG